MYVGLKTEVSEAWSTYQQALEKHASRELELQDEIKQITKAKATDKQQFSSQMAVYESTIEDLRRQLMQAHQERDEAVATNIQRQEAFESFKAQEQTLLDELAEAKANASQNVHALREDLHNALATIEILRSEQNGLLQESHMIQAKLEESNAQLVQELSLKQRELTKLQQSLSALGKGI